MEQAKPPPQTEKRAKIDLNESGKLLFEKAKSYNQNLPEGKKPVKQQHANTLFRAIALLGDKGNISPQARIVNGIPWVTLKTHGWALGKQMLQLDRQTIDRHFKRLEEAGMVVISSPPAHGKAIRSASTACLVSISPDVIAYR